MVCTNEFWMRSFHDLIPKESRPDKLFKLLWDFVRKARRFVIAHFVDLKQVQFFSNMLQTINSKGRVNFARNFIPPPDQQNRRLLPL